MDILITKRLTLRPPLEVDADAITVAMQNTNITRMLTSVPQPYSVEDAKGWIEARQRFQKDCCFMIYGQKLMGAVSVELKNGKPTLGYWLDEPFWDQGYMSEAARAVLSNSFRKAGHNFVVAGFNEDNPASGQVLEKLGFEAEGSGTHYNPTRKAEVNFTRTRLTRDRFENLFGKLDGSEAA